MNLKGFLIGLVSLPFGLFIWAMILVIFPLYWIYEVDKRIMLSATGIDLK